MLTIDIVLIDFSFRLQVYLVVWNSILVRYPSLAHPHIVHDCIASDARRGSRRMHRYRRVSYRTRFLFNIHHQLAYMHAPHRTLVLGTKEFIGIAPYRTWLSVDIHHYQPVHHACTAPHRTAPDARRENRRIHLCRIASEPDHRWSPITTNPHA